MAAIAVVLSGTAAASQETTAPIWAKPDHFWFRKAVPGGHVWLTVDALHGVKEPLFDHQRLAIELGVRGAGEFEPLALPFVDPAAEFVVKYDGSNAYIQEGALAIEFNLNDRFWRCDLQIKWNWNLVPPTDYECLPRREARPGQLRSTPPGFIPALSPDKRWAAFVLLHNVYVRAMAPGETRLIVTDGARALTTDGTAVSAYHEGSLHWSKDSRTLTGYRVHQDVWLSTSLTGNVKPHIHRGQWSISSPVDR